VLFDLFSIGQHCTNRTTCGSAFFGRFKPGSAWVG
jgi:hypothetical protein